MESTAPVVEKKAKFVSLTSLYSQVTKKCVKEKRDKTAEENAAIDSKFQEEFPKSVFKGSEWVCQNLSKKYPQ